MKTLSKKQALKKLRQVVSQRKTHRAAAIALGVDIGHLRAILYGDRQLGPTMMAALRLREAPRRYIEIEAEDSNEIQGA